MPVPSEMAEEITKAKTILDNSRALVYTPLNHLKKISEIAGKPVYIKDESIQVSGSFKVRGVGYNVYKAVSPYVERMVEQSRAGIKINLPEPFYVVTQTDGNHGIAMLEAAAFIVKRRLEKHPEIAQYIRQIEPLVFTIKHMPEIKKIKMEKALENYRQVVGYRQKGKIDNRYENYALAKKARIDFMEKHRANAVYMEHGGFNISCGHASIGIEIDEQLKKMGISENKKVALIVPTGAGGPIGMIAGLKTKRPNSIGIIVQTKPYSALVKSLIEGKIVKNKPNPKPTLVLKGKQIVFEDGIAVDAPEAGAVELAKKIVDCGLVVDPKKNLYSAAPLLYRDLSAYPNPVVGGTTSMTLQALLEYPNIKAIKEADIIVLLGAEENVDREVTNFIKKLSRLESNLSRNP